MFTFDFKQYYTKVFGTTPRNFEFPAAVEKDRVSRFGSSRYYATDATGREYFMPVNLGGIDLPYPVVRVSNKKKIVTTAMVERQGTVKELIATGDYEFTIKGFLVGQNNRWPEDLVYALNGMYTRDEALVMRSVITDIFLEDSDRVVVTALDFPEVTGIENVKPYSMRLLSDRGLELEIDG